MVEISTPGLPSRTVGEIASNDLLSCAPDTPVSEAARRMAERRCSSIIVVEDGRAVGIWTERDALAIDFADPAGFDRPVSAVMASPVRSIAADATVTRAGVAFKEAGVRHLLVVDAAGRPVGMLSQTDVVQNHGVEQYLTLRDVRSVMSRAPVLLPADLPLADAARRMRAEKAEAAIVLPGDGQDAGMLTERDLVRLAAQRRRGVTAGAVASRPLLSVSATVPLLTARNLFAHHNIRHLAVRSDAGGFTGLLSFSDILTTLQYEYVSQLNATLRERDEALIRSHQDLFLARAVIEASLEGVMIVDGEGRIDYVNPAFTRLTGYTAEEVAGRNPSVLQSGLHDDAFYDALWTALREEGRWQGEIWNRRKTGEVFAEWLSINAIRDDRGRLLKYAAIFSDITERKRHEEEVRSLAYFDALTGLPNRRLLNDRLAQAMAAAHRSGRPLAVMFVDLDLFKRINDTYGHEAGDRILTETAARLRACVGEGDTVARIGGDEFVLALTGLDDPADAGKVAEAVIDAIRAPIDLAGRAMCVTTSVGIAVYPDDGATAEALLRRADVAMYQAKQGGRNGFQVYAAALNARSHERLSVEMRLRQAFDRAEFALVYQVALDLASGRVAGVEALIRWNHPDLGTILPADFLPAVERMGLMPELGEWVLRQACRQNWQWRNAGRSDLRVSVNLSPYQFRSSELPDIVGRVLADTGLPAAGLDVELNEAVLLEHPDRVAQAMGRLNGLGVGVVIDDFGTHNSGLGALRTLPIRAVKIDRAFIAGMPGNPRDAGFVRAIVGLCHALGLRAIAKGVETAEQARLLKDAGCDAMQGHLLARELPPDAAAALFGRALLPELF